MATVIGQRPMLPAKLEPIIPQGRIERACPTEQVCTEREWYARLDADCPSTDDGFAKFRGIATGMMAERELVQFAREGRLTVDLARAADDVLAGIRLGQFPPDRVTEVRASMVAQIRRWQTNFPPVDGDRDWMEVE